MGTKQPDILIVGTGHGGAMTAAALRQRKYTGSIVLLGEEADPPYERPPLSKAYLSGERAFEDILLRPITFWSDRDITIRSGAKVVAVDAASHTVTLNDGQGLGYGQLVWAGGGHARGLTCPGADLSGVHSVRTRADIDAMMAGFDRVKQVVVIGGGYIGLEAAAVLRKLGKTVTVLEMQDRVLSRVVGPDLSHFFEAEHIRHGVDLRLNTAVSHIEGQDGLVSSVVLSNGTTLPAQRVIVGIGIVPSIQPVLDAGAQPGPSGVGGILVDDYCRTALDDVFAIGDCAAHANEFADGAVIRLESVQNAHDQAAIVARSIIGDPVAYRAVPWFWSDQYDLKLQTVGLSIGHDQTVVRGDIASRSFAVVYLKAGRVIALDCVNATRDYAQGRALVAAQISPSLDALADPEVMLKSLIPVP